MSGWNMPPGVSTNDIPGNQSDEESLEAYIASHRDGVTTEYWAKPIPWRGADWAASRDAEAHTAYGPTEEAAIRELLTWEWEHEE